jgi:LPPG:FO 2-phospho-L-lactate transferase
VILALAGGVGGARLARGLAQVLGAEELVIAVNVGDDFEHLGLSISPDLDTVMYTLADIHDHEKGWGRAGETWHFMETLTQLGGETWFRLGDRDLAVHVERTRRLRAGEALSAVTADFCARFGIRHAILPATDMPLRTIVQTDQGDLSFQDYFVRRRCQPRVQGFRFDGADAALPSLPLMRLIETGSIDGVVICPSNPWLSVAPLLAIAALRRFLESKRVPVVAVSPIVAGAAVKGPAAKLMRELGIETSALAVTRHYGRLVDGWIIDTQDADLKREITAAGFAVASTDTLMTDLLKSQHVAEASLSLLNRIAKSR